MTRLVAWSRGSQTFPKACLPNNQPNNQIISNQTCFMLINIDVPNNPKATLYGVESRLHSEHWVCFLNSGELSLPSSPGLYLALRQLAPCLSSLPPHFTQAGFANQYCSAVSNRL